MSAIVLYSEYEAYKSNWRYMMEKDRLKHEAVLRWIRENSMAIDSIFAIVFFLYIGWCVHSCYRRWCAPTEPSVDDQKIRAELVNVEHAIRALNDHRTCLIQKIKRD
jgi:hypothetical protein